MNISIVGRHFELTDPIKAHITGVLETLEKYNLDILQCRAVISAEEKKGKKGFVVDFTIVLAKANTIVIHQRDKDVYAAADLAIERAHTVLSRHHDKLTNDKHATKIEALEAEHILQDEAQEAYGSEDEIVHKDLELHKPLELEDALARLKGSQQQFLVFNDTSGRMRVLYKCSDGKYGLY